MSPARNGSPASSHKEEYQRKRRVGTVYDAVAGRLGQNGFLTDDHASSNLQPLAPEEVLVRSAKAPTQVADNWYSAERQVKPKCPLPDSDLVKAIHAYASDFYSKATPDNGGSDFRSLDETALLAMGILLEEATRESLGETGDLALVEPEELDQGLPEAKSTKYHVKGKVRPPPTPTDGSEREFSEDEARGKRRKV